MWFGTWSVSCQILRMGHLGFPTPKILVDKGCDSNIRSIEWGLLVPSIQF
jgi:hypothetical protein